MQLFCLQLNSVILFKMDDSKIPLNENHTEIAVKDLLKKINEERKKENNHKEVVEIINKYINSAKEYLEEVS